MSNRLSKKQHHVTALKDLEYELQIVGSSKDITAYKQAERALNKISEVQLMLLDNIETQIWYFSSEERYGSVNKAHAEFFGVSKEEMIGKKIYDFFSEEDSEVYRQANEQLLKTKKKFNFKMWTKNSKNENRLLSITQTPKLDEEGNVKYVVCTATDITQNNIIEESLINSHFRYQALVEDMPALICRFLPDGTLTFVNKAYCEYFSMEYNELLGKNFLDFIPLNQRLKVIEYFSSLTNDKPVITYVHQITFKDGSTRWQRWTDRAIFDINGNVVEYQSIGEDITEQKEMEDKLRHLSTYDSVTGLYNRTYFEEEMLRFANKDYAPVGIIVCDLNGLKTINDTLGHDAGDELLKSAAGVIKECFQKDSVVARIGGDEFAILLPNTTYEIVENASTRIRDNVIKYNNRQPELFLSMAIGLAISNIDSPANMKELFKEADNNMYQDKFNQSLSKQSSTFKTLLKAIEAKNFITESHASRIQEIVETICKNLGFSDREITELRLFGQFYNIGKVAIPDDIFFKPGKLTHEEFTHIKKHCEIGYRIALSSPDLAPIADWIFKHHEWWNGEGYPLRLKGEEIPIACRILAIADAYNAMTSDRPYRKAMSHDEAIATIKKCAGTQFDPFLVETFLNIINGEKESGTGGFKKAPSK